MKLSDVQKDVLGRMEYSIAKVWGNDVVIGAGNHLKSYKKSTIKALEERGLIEEFLDNPRIITRNGRSVSVSSHPGLHFYRITDTGLSALNQPNPCKL